MDKGVCYTYEAAAYPRYRYYQCRLQRLLPRWQRILDAGKLPECISQGKVVLKEIVSYAEEIVDKVQVTLFGDAAFMKTDKLELVAQNKPQVVGKIQTREITLASFTLEKWKRYAPSVTVIGILSLEEKVVKDLKAKLSHVSEAQQSNIIIYIEESKTNCTYKRLSKADFKLQDAVDQSDSSTVERSKSLSKHIQYVLEEKVVSVLEEITWYNNEFISKGQVEIADLPVNAVQKKLIRSLCNKFVVNDLSPYGKDKSEDTARKPTDNELFRVSGAVRSQWELLGPSLGITRERIDEIKQSHQTQQSKVHNILLLWRQRDDATLKYLLEVMENISKVIDVDMAVIKDIEDESLALKTEFQIDKIFHKKLLDFVAKTSKCVVCEKLSQKYGISSSLSNEFLNEGFFGYEKKVDEMMETMSLPSWPKDKSENGVAACKGFLPGCIVGITKIVQETEEYIIAKCELLTVVKKLQFELHGLLQQTDIAIETVIPDIPRLPRDLQYALLQIPEIYGCGTVWGVLELQLTDDLSVIQKEEVKNLLLQHKYMYGYTSVLIEKPKFQAGGDIEQGTEFRAEKLKPDSEGLTEYQFGSIGCFINVKQPGASNAPNEGELHCITCAHCVDKCRAIVQVKSGNGQYRNFGRTTFQIFKKEALDVATIKVDMDQLGKCERALKESKESIFRHAAKWSFYAGPIPERLEVFKYGSVTGLTRGICASNNFETKEMLENWNRQGYHFDANYNILIGPSPDNKQSTQVLEAAAAGPALSEEAFSEEGDSGSVVCNDDIETGEFTVVISLLCGDIKEKIIEGDKEKPGKFLYSYSTDMKKVVSELKSKYNCIIEPAS